MFTRQAFIALAVLGASIMPSLFPFAVHGEPLVEKCSPKLRQFLGDHSDASLVLSNASSQAFTNRDVQIVYFYTKDASIPKFYHFYLSDTSVIIACRGDVSPCDQFVGLLFEIINSRGESSFQSLFQQAEAGTISKTNFVRSILTEEFIALRSTQKQIGQLRITEKEIAESPTCKALIECPDNYNDFVTYIRRLDAPDRDPLKEYEEKYDLLRKGGISSTRTNTPSF